EPAGDLLRRFRVFPEVRPCGLLLQGGDLLVQSVQVHHGFDLCQLAAEVSQDSVKVSTHTTRLRPNRAAADSGRTDFAYPDETASTSFSAARARACPNSATAFSTGSSAARTAARASFNCAL